MQAFLIDPHARTITPAEYDPAKDHRQIYDLIDAQIFDCARFSDDGRDAVFVDDEGLYREGQAFFFIRGFPQALAGKGLVLGCDDEGETTAPACSLDWLRENVEFVVAQVGNRIFTMRGNRIYTMRAPR